MLSRLKSKLTRLVWGADREQDDNPVPEDGLLHDGGAPQEGAAPHEVEASIELTAQLPSIVESEDSKNAGLESENDETVERLILALGEAQSDEIAKPREEHEPVSNPSPADGHFQLKILEKAETQADATPTADRVQSENIIDLVRTSDCSVRLTNALNRSEKKLPVQTVQEYMRSPEISRESFLRLQNLGRKSADELDALIREYARHSRHENAQVVHERSIERKQSYQWAYEEAKKFLTGLFYPDDLLEISPPVRLANLLQFEREENRAPFSDFLETYAEAVQRLRSRKNCGRKSIEQLDELVSKLIGSRLKLHGLDASLELGLRRILAGEELPDTELENLACSLSTATPKVHEQPNSELSTIDISSAIDRLLSELDERPKNILQRRYGMGWQTAETLQEISEDYSVTRERIRQLETKAKKKLATRRTVKLLVSALEREDVLSKLFLDRKLIAEGQLSLASQALSPEEHLAIDLAYGNLKQFLESESVRTEAGWVQEQDLLSVGNESELLTGSLRQRLVEVIRAGELPIKVSKLAEAILDYPIPAIESELIESLGAELDGDIVCAAPRIPSSVRYNLILREAGHAMHCNELRARNHELFGKDESIGHIGNTLGGMEEALIVARGTYDLYENLSLTEEDLQKIRDRTHQYLAEVRGFVSVKVIYSELFQGETERFGVDFDYYMLLGILQDDQRFEAKRGMMVGLSSGNINDKFRGLREEVLAILSEAGRPMSLVDVANELEGRRDVFSTSITVSLENSPEAVSVGRGRYDLTERAIGDEQAQEKLKIASAIALSSGAKSVLALSEIILPVCGDFQSRPLKSFLQNRSIFKIDGDIVSLAKAPENVAMYIQARENAAMGTENRYVNVTLFKKSLKEMEVPDFVHLDPLLASEVVDEDATGKDEILDKLLGEFGIN